MSKFVVKKTNYKISTQVVGYQKIENCCFGYNLIDIFIFSTNKSL